MTVLEIFSLSRLSVVGFLISGLASLGANAAIGSGAIVPKKLPVPLDHCISANISESFLRQFEHPEYVIFFTTSLSLLGAAGDDDLCKFSRSQRGRNFSSLPALLPLVLRPRDRRRHPRRERRLLAHRTRQTLHHQQGPSLSRDTQVNECFELGTIVAYILFKLKTTVLFKVATRAANIHGGLQVATRGWTKFEGHAQETVFTRL